MAKRNVELRVGIFVLVGIVILSVIVFSIGDMYFYKPGYHLKITYGFVSGVEIGSPVRLAGVEAGEIKDVILYRDPETVKTRVEVLAWINKDISVEKDAKAYINTLGLFGEKYVEILPGVSAEYLIDGDTMKGEDPIPVEKFTRQLQELASDTSKLIADLREASGSAKIILARIRDGEGSVGKLLKEEKIYNDLEAFVEDIRKHPWKLLSKPRRTKEKQSEKEIKEEKGSKGTVIYQPKK